MKLIRLKIFESFRSLPANFEVHFRQKAEEKEMFHFNPYCLVGRNGSGKSNILEALAAIFYHLECMQLKTLPESFVYDVEENPNGFRSDKAVIDAFEIEYRIQINNDLLNRMHIQYVISSPEITAHILISKAKGELPIIHWLNAKLFTGNPEYTITPLELRNFFPDYILAYSSGENEILSLPFLKMRFIHYDEYEQALRKQLNYVQPEGRLIYFDNSFSQAVFLTNYLMQEHRTLEPIYKTLGIKGISQFRIIVRLNEIKRYYNESPLIGETMSSPTPEEEYTTVELTSKLSNLIKLLKNCSTTWENDEDNLYLDYCIDEETQIAFRSNFESPIKLFQSFQILLTLNVFEVSFELKKELYESTSLYVNETVPVLASDRRIMRFKDLEIDKGNLTGEIYNKSLSDGEHQFLHAMGICLLFKNSASLFLLDEPETHFNPEWRSLFISTLRDCLEPGDKKISSEFLITTHSPFIVSDCERDNVLIFGQTKGKVKKVKVSRPDFNTFGASVNLLTHKLFHKEETISEIAKKRLNEVLKKYKMGDIDLPKAVSLANQLGDSVEKLIIIDELKRMKGSPKRKLKGKKKN
jgi:restriction system-associated AAA family ATPase